MSVISYYNQSIDNDLEGVPKDVENSSKRDIIIYSILFVISAAGNISVFTALLRNRNRKLRINLLIFNLAIADLIVTFIMIPLEVGWRITESWIAGDFACRLLQALRAFGPYLSSMVLVCISFDRYFAIIHPLKVNDAHRRSKIMLSFSWIISIACSAPQSMIYHVESHPDYPKFEQCVTFNFFKTAWKETFYNIFCVMALYVVPLLIIICCYTRILWEIYRRSKESSEGKSGESSNNKQISSEYNCKSRQTQSQRLNNSSITRNRMHLRRSDVTQIERARTRTLRMTLIIVLAFVWCWTPYVFIVLLYQIDSETAKKLDKGLQNTLFMFAVSNSCVNPLVYGSYSLNFRRIWKRYFAKYSFIPFNKHDSNTDANTSRRSTYIDDNTTYSNVEVSPPSPLSYEITVDVNGSISTLHHNSERKTK
ncbi:adipokinetic hormone/corazonin-related peptide receptor variant I-like [Oppia nitens]|uniref:adipokinetic hormone/corazonin-related peptide receptor variant I-like n=1 Tax=Oppia nitens TaxID=1686743 RepID=UPI0023DCA8A6|nr:adipokinetic hormone/corazonin-related peptide receptor variant I-like [Oppia nitens]